MTNKTSVKTTNTTVFNTEDIMSYVTFFNVPDNIVGIKIRYMNNHKETYKSFDPTSGKPVYERSWVSIKRDYRRDTMDIAILRAGKQSDGSPLTALAQAADEVSVARPKLRDDLIKELKRTFYGTEAALRASASTVPIRIADKADKLQCKTNALKNLKIRVGRQTRKVRDTANNLKHLKKTVKRLKTAIPEIETKTLPSQQAELKKMRKLLKKREEEARALGISV